MDNYQRIIKITVNDRPHTLIVENNRTLLDVLREQLGLKGTKYACGKGECGACTVIINGRPVLACMTLAVNADGEAIQTIEGLSQGGKLHPIQQAFIDYGAIQCGFCTPGMIMSAKALLDENPHPSEEEIRFKINGNLCRCTGYAKIVAAIMAVAAER
ncbi:(2Fe-2S)-binding protein [Chloroflexota bacterium]